MHAIGSGRLWHVHRHQRHHSLHEAKNLLRGRRETELFARFTTVAGERGAADAERDIRGFAIKSTPRKATGTWSATTRRCLLRDPLKFPDLNHASQARSTHNLRQREEQLGFWTSLPERCTRSPSS